MDLPAVAAAYREGLRRREEGLRRREAGEAGDVASLYVYVAEVMNLDQNYLRNLVVRCRREGLLPPTEPRRARA